MWKVVNLPKTISKTSFDSKDNLHYSDDFDESGDASDIEEGEFDIDLFLCCKELIKNLRCNWWIRIYPTPHMTTRNSIENKLLINFIILNTTEIFNHPPLLFVTFFLKYFQELCVPDSFVRIYLFIYSHFQTMFWNEYLFDIFLFWNLVSVVSTTL